MKGHRYNEIRMVRKPVTTVGTDGIDVRTTSIPKHLCMEMGVKEGSRLYWTLVREGKTKYLKAVLYEP